MSSLLTALEYNIVRLSPQKVSRDFQKICEILAFLLLFKFQNKSLRMVGFLLYCIFPACKNETFTLPHFLLYSKSYLTFRRRIKSRLPFAGIIRRLPYSTLFQGKG